MVESSHEQRWVEAVESWSRWQPRWSAMTEPLDDELIRAAGVRAGMKVLDLACGSGDPALALARAVGDRGRVIAADPVAGMLDVARRRLEHAGLTNVEVIQGSLGVLPFPDATFDIVTCRFGLVYAADPGLAVREMTRVLVPGGRVAVMVWGDRSKNEYWSVEFDALARLPIPATQEVAEPIEFTYEDRGSLAAVLSAAGLRSVAEEALELPLRWPGPPEELWQEVMDDAAGLDREVQVDSWSRFRDEVRRGFEALSDGRSVVMRSLIIIGVGQRGM